MVYDIDGKQISLSSKTDAIISAHRGYHAAVAQNSLKSITDAADAGFDCVELDIRKTADGVYVLAHDATMTMYSSGASVSVKFATSNYSTIRNYTWDSAGKYRLCTLAMAFNSIKALDMVVICDLKAGVNSEIVQLASMCGVADKIILSYSTFANAVADMELLARYSWIPIRVVPNGVGNASTLINGVKNVLYADVNAASIDNVYINNALALGMPILFAGCTNDNYKIWAVLAKGVMANLNLNITHEQFKEYLTNDYDKVVTITESASSVSVASGSTATITATSDESSAAGWIYGYCIDPLIASAKQTTFGESASFTITGLSVGTTSFRIFTGTGEYKDIAVTVS